MTKHHDRRRLAVTLLTVAAVFLVSLALGRYPITLSGLLAGEEMTVRTFTLLRLPRAVMALLGDLAGGRGYAINAFAERA